MREKARLDSFRRSLKSWLTYTSTLSGKQCLSVAVSEQIPRANLNTSSQIMRPALQTEFSVLKHSQTFWIWDWALHDIFPKSRLVMVAESSGRRSVRNSAPPFTAFSAVWQNEMKAWKHFSTTDLLLYDKGLVWELWSLAVRLSHWSDCVLTLEQRSQWLRDIAGTIRMLELNS